MIFFACPSCKKAYVGKDQSARKKAPCTACKSMIEIPVPPKFDLLRHPTPNHDGKL